MPATVPDKTLSPSRAIGAAASRFLNLLPALVLAFLCLRATELLVGVQAGTAIPGVVRLAVSALGQDLFSLAKYLPGLFLYSLPFLVIQSRRGQFWSLGLAWSLLVLVQAVLVQYFLTARVPLGADLFGYSWRDIRETISGGAKLNAPLVLGAVLALGGLWSALAMQSRRSWPVVAPWAAATVFALALVVAFAVPKGDARSGTEDAYNLSLNKATYFFDDSLSYLTHSRTSATPVIASLAAKSGSASGVAGFRYLDPKYPFLHTEQTPDVLGPYFQIRAGSPPNLVFIIVEGLGRSFSGPDAALGSFTPRLDQIAKESLYWENFLAVQGRTFAVLPSVFASLPFGQNGFASLGERMPAHASLLSVLKRQGYRLKFYCGFDPDFDNERLFLLQQGMDVLVGVKDFGAEYPSGNSWGYADNELVTRALAGEAQNTQQPFVSVIQTITTHTPYEFPGRERFYTRFEQRLEELGVVGAHKDAYRAYRDIYASILYTDDALGRFFDEAKNNPAYQNTVFVVTGDHRLPEIPMATRIDRYHVPLLIFSPLLTAPARIKSVSSHFDIAPSLLAFLSHNYGIRTPQAVTWIGAGLDMEPSFRNIHDFPMKQTTTNLVDFLSGTWFVSQDKLYTLSDGMDIEPSNDDTALARVQAQFAAFRGANDHFAQSLTLIPEGSAGQMTAYRDADRTKPLVPIASHDAVLVVGEVHAPEDVQAGQLTIGAVFANTGQTATDTFVPIVVLLTADGVEVSESYGSPHQLQAGESASLQLAVKSMGVPPGDYFLAVIATHPITGQRLGTGRYHIPI